MLQRKIFGRKIEKTITSDDILGKNVIDTEGKVAGRVEKVLIDPKSLDFIGIEIDKGFLKKGLIIGKSYIAQITNSVVFLNIRAVHEIKGMQVFDKNGKKVGSVKEVELWGNKNKIKNIHVRIGMMKKEIIVSSDLIEAIGKNVVLKVREKDLLN